MRQVCAAADASYKDGESRCRLTINGRDWTTLLPDHVDPQDGACPVGYGLVPEVLSCVSDRQRAQWRAEVQQQSVAATQARPMIISNNERAAQQDSIRNTVEEAVHDELRRRDLLRGN
jgi:hypothetical protein